MLVSTLAWLTLSGMKSDTGGISFKCVTCTKEEEAKVAEAENIANQIVQSDCFKKFMLDWGLLWTNGKTPEEVVTHLQTSQLEVPVHYYRGRCSVVGYRNPGKPDIYLNRCSHDKYDSLMTASNATHEWSHVLGYDHPKWSKRWRGRTVPYAINKAFESCGKMELVTGLEPATDGLQNRSSTN